MTKTKTKDMTYCSIFTALLCVCAMIPIPLPITPVPITLQLFALFLSSIMQDKKMSFLTAVVYILLGVCGLPVFAGFQSGLGYLMGITGGFLIGFIPASYIISGLLENKEKTTINTILAVTAGLVIVYACGVTQFMLVTGASLSKAVTATVLPFIVADYLKVILAIIIYKYLKMAKSN